MKLSEYTGFSAGRVATLTITLALNIQILEPWLSSNRNTIQGAYMYWTDGQLYRERIESSHYVPQKTGRGSSDDEEKACEEMNNKLICVLFYAFFAFFLLKQETMLDVKRVYKTYSPMKINEVVRKIHIDVEEK
uniref:Uncharacterized protein n=1 Tax=Romanomermis culicivorax TaxID=13658 RepID=A0A915KGF2_ROMCU